MTEDHDITRKKEQMFVPPERLLDVDTFGLHVQQVLKDLFGLNAKVANPVYNLEDFGKGIYYCLIYRSEQGKRLLFSLLLDENLVLKTVSEMPGIPFDKIDNVVLYATRQMARHVLKRISAFFRFQGVYRFEKDVFLDEERFHKQVNVDNPYCSLLFETQYGPMAICVNM